MGVAMGRCGSLWGRGRVLGVAVGRCVSLWGRGRILGVTVGRCGSLWGRGCILGVSVGRCGALWVAVGPRSDAALQDELHVLDSLELPAADGRLLLELADFRRWGGSALIVDL